MISTVRKFTSQDRESVICILRDLKEFEPFEVDIAIELIDAYLKDAEKSGYYLAVVLYNDKVSGYICYGPTPLTRGTWDIYWIAVSKDVKYKGCGKALLKYAEDHIRTMSGRMIIIETSSRDIYESARKFYVRNGYKAVCCIDDFYSQGDSKILFLKRL